jgi:hypothetical protein
VWPGCSTTRRPGHARPSGTHCRCRPRCFTFDSDDLGNPAYGYENTTGTGTTGAIVDLALFYGRNNLLINGDQGWVPGNVFGAVVEGLDEMAAACQDLWMGGVRGETLSFSRRD